MPAAPANHDDGGAAGAADVHVTIVNRSGSVQHYYHFLLGFVVPLLEQWPVLERLAGGGRVFVRSCAVLDPLLRELRLPGLAIVDPAEHAAMRERAAAAVRPLRPVTLSGYDAAARYQRRVFDQVRGYLFARFAAAIEQERAMLELAFPGDGRRVLVIERLPPDAFYATAACELPGAGSQRRSIANFQELCATARRHAGDVLVTALEGRSLFHQIALFGAADVVICQHGAALANLLWARPGTRVIEITPRRLEPGLRGNDVFGELARCLAQERRQLWQDFLHGPVDTAALSELLLSVIRD
jgi:hypothetical protein